MKTQLKQRWVGLLVFVAIMALFLPILFHNREPTSVPVPSQPPTHQTSDQASSTVPVPTAQSIPLNEAPVFQHVPVEQVLAPPAPRQQHSTKTPQSQSVVPSQAAQTVPRAQVRRAHQAQQTVTHTHVSRHVTSSHIANSAWVVQVASFKDQARAQALLQQLRHDHYTAYARQFGEAAQRRWRVYVGPYIAKSRASQVRQQLFNTMTLQGLVMQYAVEQGESDDNF